MTDKLSDGHEHIYSINFGYEQIECTQYQHGCNVMIDKDEAERRINEFPALEQRVEELEKALYEAIEVGGAPESMWVDTDEQTKRAWPIPDIDLEEALVALAAEEKA